MARRKPPRNNAEKLDQILGTPRDAEEEPETQRDAEEAGGRKVFPASGSVQDAAAGYNFEPRQIPPPAYRPINRRINYPLDRLEEELLTRLQKERKREEDSKFKFNMTPRELHEKLTKYVIGQGEALQKVCNAVCYHYQNLSRNKDYKKANALLIGPTGCGKTYVVEKISSILDLPLLTSDATRFSGTGYVGDNVESLVQDLVTKADGDLNKASRGIIYLDEIDKIAAEEGHGRDVNGKDVQNGLLKILEKGEFKVMCKEGERLLNTKDILFIGGGAFSGISNSLRDYFVSDPAVKAELNDEELLYEASPPELIKALKKFGMIPELIGRMPSIIRFRQLDKNDLIRILKEAEESPIKKYQNDFKSYGIDVSFALDSYETIAEIAYERGMGARGLVGVLEESLTPFKFYLPGTKIKSFDVKKETIANPNEAILSLIKAKKEPPKA